MLGVVCFMDGAHNLREKVCDLIKVAVLVVPQLSLSLAAFQHALACKGGSSRKHLLVQTLLPRAQHQDAEVP